MTEDLKNQTIPPPDFELGEEVIAVFPSKIVLSLVVGQTYTITNMEYDYTWGWRYEIENYKRQIFDDVEFPTFFRHKYEIKEDINKEENIKKFIRLTAYISVKKGDKYRLGRRIKFDNEKFDNDQSIDDLKQDIILPVLIKKLKKLIGIVDYDPEYAFKEIEDLWIYL
jgi:hypothetical protein